jgi:hypothetical protein
MSIEAAIPTNVIKRSEDNIIVGMSIPPGFYGGIKNQMSEKLLSMNQSN